jgi:2-methylisocitrate lyase-like PEP mutase family enzyme
MNNPSNSEVFRSYLTSEKVLAIPGCYDAFSAKVIEKLGFPYVYLTGFGVEASRLGKPDMGLMTMNEIADHARNIVDAVSIPLISDIDTGFGGLLNLDRTIHTFEKAGVAGVHFEDQMFPKKCGAMSGRTMIEKAEMVSRIRIALHSRKDPNFVLIARSDAKEPLGFEAVKDRLFEYLNAGADLIMIGERYTLEELAELGREFTGKLVFCGGIVEWEETNLPVSEYGTMGIKIVIYPLTGICAVAKALQRIYEPLREKGHITPKHLKDDILHMNQVNQILDIDRYNDLSNCIFQE